MTMHQYANLFAKTFTALALLLSFGLVGQTCSTQSPEEVLNPDGGDGGGDGGGDEDSSSDKGPSSPEHGALILDGRPLIVDVSPHQDIVDVHSVLSIYFNESMNTNTITSESFELREEPLGVEVPTRRTWLMANRLLIIEPQFVLTPNTSYQLLSSEGPVDLDGLAYDTGDNPLLLEFTTADDIDGLAPEVLASYPLDGTLNQPNDSEVVLVFSKAIRTDTISTSVSLNNISAAAVPADYDTSATPYCVDRVFSFSHRADENDLNAIVQLVVSEDLEASDIMHLPLENAYQRSWQTMALQRPTGISFEGVDFNGFQPAANSYNYQAFELGVLVPLTSQTTDSVFLRVHQYDDNHISDSRLVEGQTTSGSTPALDGLSFIAPFELNLTETIVGEQSPVFSTDSEMLMASFLERDGLRSSVSLRLDAEGEPALTPHDITSPSLSPGHLGANLGSFSSQFRTTLPVVRPFGIASESIGFVSLDGTIDRFAPYLSDDNFFIGGFFTPQAGNVTEGPEDFVLSLKDTVGNNSPAEDVSAKAYFRGFVGGTDLDSPSNLQVIAFDQEDLSPIKNAQIFVQNVVDDVLNDGLNEVVLEDAVDGIGFFANRRHAQTITIQAEGYYATTIIGVDASIVSLPLEPISSSEVSVSPQIENLPPSMLQISSNTLLEDSGEPNMSLTESFVLLESDVFTVGDSFRSRVNQPGWFVAFDDVKSYDDVSGSSSNRYFRYFGYDERILASPSTSSLVVVQPLIEMKETANPDSSGSEYLYSFDPIDNAPLSGSAMRTASISARVPGIVGKVVVGIGDIESDLTRGSAQLEKELFDSAVAEGADPDHVDINLYAEWLSGDSMSFTETRELDDDPSTYLDFTWPDPVSFDPDPPFAWNAPATYPYTINLDDPKPVSFAEDKGLCKVTLFDTVGGYWNIFILPSVADSERKLPQLGGDSVNIPLSTTDFNVEWEANVQFFEIDLPDERGFFFEAVARDCVSWVKSKDIVLKEDF